LGALGNDIVKSIEKANVLYEGGSGDSGNLVFKNNDNVSSEDDLEFKPVTSGKNKKKRSKNTNNNFSSTNLSLNSYNYFFINLFSNKTELFSLVTPLLYINTICEYLYFVTSFNFLPTSFFSFNIFFTSLLNNLFVCFDISNFYLFFSSTYSIFVNNTQPSNKLYQVQDFNSELLDSKNTFIESSDSTRYNRFFNILINYDYKTGHYIGN
jgi:hypothetical protein